LFDPLSVAAATPSRFDVAAPFLGSVILTLVAPFVSMPVERRLASTYREWDASAGGSVLPGHHDPDQIAHTTLWAIDATQILAGLLGPIVGLLVFHPTISNALALVYVLAIVGSVGGFLGFVHLVSPDRYESNWLWVFSPVAVVVTVASLIAAGIAAAIGP
jgi:hypothetical protein